MKNDRMIRWFSFFFLISGFCSLIYEIVWLRLAMAQFGVNTPLISIFLSLFMAGLGLGSWLAGYLTRRTRAQGLALDLKLYAFAEFMTALGGFVAPSFLTWGHKILAGSNTAWASGTYFFASAACIAVAIVPYCIFMGTTIPLIMSAIKKGLPSQAKRSFSFLYTANVLGAALGTLISAFVLIEILGFRGTGRFAAILNLILGGAALGLGAYLPASRGAAEKEASQERMQPSRILAMLFITGFVSMAMEVIWTRQLIPFLGLHVYAFASILAIYLIAYNLGSYAYRHAEGSLLFKDRSIAWALTGVCGCLTVIAADPRLPLGMDLRGAIFRLYLSVTPFSAAMGFLTPMLVDYFSSGNPELAGKGYAVNVLGCILGPLAASFALLPFYSERWSETLLLLVFCILGYALSGKMGASKFYFTKRLNLFAALVVLLVGLGSSDFDSIFNQPIVLRDSSATVVASRGNEHKYLLVNGIPMTLQVNVTKFMAHLPLAFLARQPQNALVICFGMGTTFRALLSWQIPATAVELVPSVPKVFGYFYPDGPGLLNSPLAKVFIDDGRRFLERTRDQYDVVTLDPAPPIEASANSLLYTPEFYALVKARLKPGGILQQWHSNSHEDLYVLKAILSSLMNSFRYVRVFQVKTLHNLVGFHFLASDTLIPRLSSAELARRMPPSAAKDFLEWSPQFKKAESQFDWILSNEIPMEKLLSELPSAPPLEDNRPQNEYYLLRKIASFF